MFMFTNWEGYLQARLNHVQEGSYDEGQDIWDSSLFSKKTALIINRNKGILSDRSLRPV